MPNKHRGEVAISIGGEDKILCFDWEAVADLQDALGNDFDQKIAQASIEMDLPVLAEALAIGLQKHNPMSAEQITKASPPILEVTNGLNRALHLAFYGKEMPDPEVAEKQPENPPIETATKTSPQQRGKRLSGRASAVASSGR